ncbi:MAG: hypothetical protein ACEPOZ_19460 [Marinifilaceae bacterium]
MNASLSPLQELTQKYREKWNCCATDFPTLSKSFNRLEKGIGERRLDRFFDDIKTQEKDWKGDSRKFFTLMKTFFREGLAYSEEQLEVILSDEMVEATRSFVIKARAFDAELSKDEIFQACRNVWIMNGLQYVFGKPIEITPSIFAYSMLYPYTDNYIDDPTISQERKEAFSRRFYQRLDGEALCPENEMEERIFSLVEMIEGEFHRKEFPQVYQSLLAIHEAQSRSAGLINSRDQLSEGETFEICVKKGATSVIADGCLILGSLDEKQLQFLFEYGAYLQLLDDLQDASEDYKGQLFTCFSRAIPNEKLDQYLCRTYNMGREVLQTIEDLYPKQKVFKSLMQKSIDLFLVEAIVNNQDYFSSQFAGEFERYSPFRFDYIREKSSTLSPYQSMLFQQIEKLAMEEVEIIG